ncbi:hypothetical protein AB0M46_00165 [Dactylosporangium sp. NPDC051485]|uniref:hypothetical protein n=1 Tax=Dactylosporangium sp. NPDC051485 TaxID=3154846 RepID=UPI00342B146E
MADEPVSPSPLEVSMLTASRPASEAGRRESDAAARPWPTNAAEQRLTGPGTGVSRSTGWLNAPALGSLLVCDGCDRPLQLSWSPEGRRRYVFLCGCQRAEVDAALVERLIRDRVEAESAILATDISPEELSRIVRALFVAVRIGNSADDLVFVWRI